MTSRAVARGSLPDRDLGYRGERYVYEQELARMEEIGQLPEEVKWTSQVAPASPFDIRTMRETPKGVREHFLEVKSSALADGENVYLSSHQIKFLEDHRDCASVVLVQIEEGEAVSKRELTIDELRAEFNFNPIKYKLVRR